MRLYTALEHLKAKHYKTVEEWEPGFRDDMAAHVIAVAPLAVEFCLEFLDVENNNDTLSTFIDFSNEMWNAGIIPLPHQVFWVSWYQKVRDQNIHMAALCERQNSDDDGRCLGLAIRLFFETLNRDGLVMVNRDGTRVLGEKSTLVSLYSDSVFSQTFVEFGVNVVGALLGALATPQAIRRDVPAPAKLNVQRRRKGREPIGALIVIDVRASQQASALRHAGGGRTVRPHWRRGHLRHLPNGKITPIPPCCVNMEEGVPMKPEYLVRL